MPEEIVDFAFLSFQVQQFDILDSNFLLVTQKFYLPLIDKIYYSQ